MRQVTGQERRRKRVTVMWKMKIISYLNDYIICVLTEIMAVNESLTDNLLEFPNFLLSLQELFLKDLFVSFIKKA